MNTISKQIARMVLLRPLQIQLLIVAAALAVAVQLSQDT